MPQIVEETDITREEWEKVRTEIGNARYRGKSNEMYDRGKLVRALLLLEELGNAPTARHVLFIDLFEKAGEKPLAISAWSAINAILTTRKFPYQLHTVGTNKRAGSTYDGLIQIVRIRKDE